LKSVREAYREAYREVATAVTVGMAIPAAVTMSRWSSPDALVGPGNRTVGTAADVAGASAVAAGVVVEFRHAGRRSRSIEELQL